MKRKMIEIDESRCTGCGKCIPNCAEGALQLIDGKARLVSDLFCDGLGACIGTCPTGALRIVEREAEPYNEKVVMENIAKGGKNTILAHLQHLKNHGEMELYRQAKEYLMEKEIDFAETPEKPCAEFKTNTPWPLQLALLNPASAFLDDADLLIAADCTAFACKAFQSELRPNRIMIVFCPKLDGRNELYVEKLAEVFRRHSIRSVTVARMEVPCCKGTEMIVQKALALAGVELKIQTVVVGIDGDYQRGE